MYDGHISVDLSTNANHLERVFMLAAVHPSPKRVLVVGLSTGAWTKVLLGFPNVEHVDVVEINPGYISLIRQYPVVSSILDDSRVHIFFDDARRWLKRHPDRRYDLIVMNTTFSWRANSTNLLSLEFFKEIQRHLSSGGIAAINTTGSLDVFRTAIEAFPFAFRYSSFVYGSDRDIRVDPSLALSRLEQCLINGNPAFGPEQFEQGGLAYKIIDEGLKLANLSLIGLDFQPEVITDRNLVTEFRHGKLVAPAAFSWIWPTNPGGSCLGNPTLVTIKRTRRWGVGCEQILTSTALTNQH